MHSIPVMMTELTLSSSLSFPSFSSDGSIKASLVRINEPVARIPNLAIHLSTSRSSFEPNLHEHLQAILTVSAGEESAGLESPFHPVLLGLVSKACGISMKSVIYSNVLYQLRIFRIVAFCICEDHI